MKHLALTLAVVFAFSTFFIAPARAATICDDFSTNLSSHWKLEEASGTREDIHGTNDLTDNNTVTSGTGKIDTAADLERSNSEYLSLAEASATSLNPTDDFSISFWYNAESLTDGNWNGLVSKQDTGDTTPGPFNTGILRDGSTYYFLFGVYDGSTARGNLFTINSYVSIGTWYHVVVTFDKGTGDKDVYINGTNVQSETVTVTTYSDQSDFRIGWKNKPSANDGWDGLIDEVSFWNGRLITSGEVTTLYNSGAGIPYACAGGGGEATTTPFMPIQGDVQVSGDVIMSR